MSSQRPPSRANEFLAGVLARDASRGTGARG